MADHVREQYDPVAVRARLEREVRVGRAIARRYLLELHVVLYGEAACPFSVAVPPGCFACSRVPDVVAELSAAPAGRSAPPVTV